MHKNARWLGGLLLAVAAAAPLHAQGDGFLFGPPSGTITVRGGFAHANANSDLFTDLTQQFTLTKRSFSGFTGGADVALMVTPSLDVTFDVGYMSTTSPSHYRDFVDLDNAEIEQSTTLQRTPVTVNAKLYLAPQGRSIGRLAWIPAHVAPWVGGGAGYMFYRLQQSGDFIDPTTNAVRPDALESSGSTPMLQAMAGADLNLTSRLALTGDARYLWTKGGTLDEAFYSGYDRLDLSGVALTLGLTVRF